MRKEHTAVFIGHRTIYTNILEEVDIAITNAIESGIDCFLNGGMGHFDILCAWRLNILQSRYPHIKQYLVLPYKNYNNYDRQIYRDIIYTSNERYYTRAAIPKRNRWMVENASYAICYVGKETGGAVKTYKYAEDKGLKIINIPF